MTPSHAGEYRPTYRKGEKPYEAALKGSKEIGFTIVSMTLSLAAVFIPFCSWQAFWAALPRVRDHYLHRHPDLRDGLDQPHANVV